MRKGIACLLIFVLFASPVYAANGSDFNDIQGHWAYDSIDKMVQEGLFKGTSKDKFSPDKPLSRAMFVTILGRYYESIFYIEPWEKTAVNQFSDTQKYTWYSPYVGWAAYSGIISGYGNDKFGPNDPLTREQCVKILYGFADYLRFQRGNSNLDILKKYPDGNKVSAWAREPFAWAIDNKIVSRVVTDKLLSKQVATRAECAVILDNYLSTYSLSKNSLYDVSYVASGQVNTGFRPEMPYFNTQIENMGSNTITCTLVLWNKESSKKHELLYTVKLKSGEIGNYSGKLNPDNQYLELSVVASGDTIKPKVSWRAAMAPFK